MTHTAHHHHHHPGEEHPPATVHASILRMSALERSMAALVAVALLWAVVFWAMG